MHLDKQDYLTGEERYQELVEILAKSNLDLMLDGYLHCNILEIGTADYSDWCTHKAIFEEVVTIVYKKITQTNSILTLMHNHIQFLEKRIEKLEETRK